MLDDCLISNGDLSSDLVANVNFRQLIDMAVGIPSKMNFYALHWLLLCFGEKLQILEDPIDFSQYQNTTPKECMEKMPFVQVSQNVSATECKIQQPSGSTFDDCVPKTKTRTSAKKTKRAQKSKSARVPESHLPFSIDFSQSSTIPPEETYFEILDSQRSRIETFRSKTEEKGRFSGGLEMSASGKSKTARVKSTKKLNVEARGSKTSRIKSSKNQRDETYRLTGGDDEPKADDAPADDKPADKPEEKPEDKPEEKPEEKAEDKPEEKAEPKTEDKPEEKPEDKPEEKAEDKTEDKVEEKAEAKSEDKSEEEAPKDKPEDKPDDKAKDKPEDKNEGKSDEKTASPGEDKPVDSGGGEGDDLHIPAPPPPATELTHSSERSEPPESFDLASSEMGEEEARKEHKGLRDGSQVDLSNLVTRSELDIRLVGVDTLMKSPLFSEETHRGISIMRDQLELAMEHVRILSAALLDAVKDEETKRILRILLTKLLEIRNENIYIPGDLRVQDLLMKEEFEDEEEQTELTIKSDDSDFIKDGDLLGEEEECMSLSTLYRRPSSIFREEIAKIKTDICNLYNKITELTAAFLELDCEKLFEKIEDLNGQMEKLRNKVNVIAASHDALQIRVTELATSLQETNKFCDYLDETKANLVDMEMRLAQKGDITLVARKVSHEKLDDAYNQLEKKNCELRKIVITSERNIMDIIDNLRYTLGIDHFHKLLREYQKQIEKELNLIRADILRLYDLINFCPPAGAHQSVLNNVKCLCCDAPCEMSAPKRKPGPPNAHATPALGAIVTYQLSTLRKDNDNFGYACDTSYAAVPEPNQRLCPPRYAGGKHTTHTRQEFVEKVFQK